MLLVLSVLLGSTNAQIFSDSLLVEGIKNGYNFQFTTANIFFDEYSKNNPSSLKAEFLKVKLKLWKYVGSKSQNSFTEFNISADKLISILEEKLDENSEDKILRYLIASSYTSKTIALSANHQIVDAFWSAKKAMSYLEDLIDEFPELNEPYLEMGILTYALSYVEGFATVALTLSGMSADKDQGLQMLLKANNGNVYSKIESSFYLSQVYSEYLADNEQSIKYLLPAAESFPDNILFSFQLAVLYTKNCELDKAEKTIKRFINIKDESFSQTLAFSRFLLGDLYLRSGRYEQALKEFQKFLIGSNDINYSSKAYYSMALCNLFLGRNYEVHRNLSSTNLGNLENSDDKFARRRSQLLQNYSFNSNLENLLKAEIQIFNKNYNQTENYLSKIKSAELNEEFRKLFDYLKAEVLFNNNKSEEAEKILKNLTDSDIESEKWLIPASNLLLARVYLKQKNYDKTADFLEEAEDENEYDFRSKLTGEINKLKLRLSNRN